ncbi:hypothetical protein Adt_14225 [Abeliophyllum distichum]|uniref:Uncharacterized protein n=1 Tax=Abeliophyllum distichum TaxID=126358 RepID=A0ABD1TZ24_9LAMI
MAGSLYLWFRHSLGFEMPLHVFQMVYLLKKLPRKKDQWKESGWKGELDILRAIYERSAGESRFDPLLKMPKHLIELEHMASKADFRLGKRPTLPLAKLIELKVKELWPDLLRIAVRRKLLKRSAELHLKNRLKELPPN